MRNGKGARPRLILDGTARRSLQSPLHGGVFMFHQIGIFLLTIWSCVLWVFAGLITAFWGSLSVLGSFFSKSGKFQFFCMKAWSRSLCFGSWTKVTVEGLEHVNRSAPQIFAANHQAVYDILILAGWLPVQFGWVVRKEWYKTPFMGWHLAHSGNVPIDRSNPRASAKSLIEAVAIIRGGVNVCIFPEGTRNKDAMLQDFKGGAFVLAQKAGVPIVPVTILGTKNVIRKNTWLIRRASISMIISPPIDPNSYDKQDRDRLQYDVEDAIAAHLPGECLVDYHARKARREADKEKSEVGG